MSLKHRQQTGQQHQQFTQQLGNTGSGGDSQRQTSPVQLQSGREFVAVVDGEIVNVIGTTDIPGMSPAYWCQSEEDGSSAPVSTKEAAIFSTPQRALQYLLQQQGNTLTRANR